jgi:predicted RNA-binding Zn ribbon-like protein
MVDGSWSRLKACRNHGCRWAFYDYSRNRSASWCSMQLCGNRTKTRTYRRRRGATA